MPKITEALLTDLVWIYFGVFLVAAYFGFRYRRQLRKFHPDVWREMGSQPLFNSSIMSSLKTLRFIVVQKHYRALGDPKLRLYGDGFRIGFIAVLCFIAGFFILILIAQQQNGEGGAATTRVTYLAPLWLNAFGFGTVGTYLFLLWRISARMEKLHNSLWEELQRPFSLDINSVMSMWKLGVYVLVSSRHRSLNDREMSLMIYATRFLFLAAMIWVLLAHQIGHQVTVQM